MSFDDLQKKFIDRMQREKDRSQREKERNMNSGNEVSHSFILITQILNQQIFLANCELKAKNK